jgi:opacity protein-like surface antigen
MLKKIICIVVLWLAFLTPVHAQQSLIWHLLAAVDHRFYEKDSFKFAGGLMYIYANYDDSENLNEDSNLFFLYAKPSLKIANFMPYVIVGAGTDSEYYDGLTGLVGAGLDYNFYERWSVGVSYLHAENSDRTYNMGTASIKYDF